MKISQIYYDGFDSKMLEVGYISNQISHSFHINYVSTEQITNHKSRDNDQINVKEKSNMPNLGPLVSSRKISSYPRDNAPPHPCM